MARANLDLRPLPALNRHGRYPAVEYARASIARDLIAQRKRLGLTPQQLAELAGIRQESLAHLESGKHPAKPRTLDKIARALDSERQPVERRKARGLARSPAAAGSRLN